MIVNDLKQEYEVIQVIKDDGALNMFPVKEEMRLEDVKRKYGENRILFHNYIKEQNVLEIIIEDEEMTRKRKLFNEEI